MKLHLPLALLSAVMACLASVASATDFAPSATAVSLGSADRLWSDSATTAQSAPVTLTGDSTIGGSANYSITGLIGGEGFGFTKDGTGTLTLTAHNTYSGDTIVKTGILKLEGADAAISSNGKILSGATLEFATTGTTPIDTAGVWEIAGTGSAGQGAIRISADLAAGKTTTFKSTLKLTGDTLISSKGSTSLDNQNRLGSISFGGLMTDGTARTLTLDGGVGSNFNLASSINDSKLNITLTNTAQLTLPNNTSFRLGVVNVGNANLPSFSLNAWNLTAEGLVVAGLNGGGAAVSNSTAFYYHYNNSTSVYMEFATAAGSIYAWNGNFQGNNNSIKINLVKSGEGTQIFNGYISSGSAAQAPSSTAKIDSSAATLLGTLNITGGTFQLGGTVTGDATASAEMPLSTITIAGTDGQTGTLAFNTTTAHNYRNSGGIIGGTGATILLKSTNTANITLSSAMTNYKGLLKVEGGTLTMAAANELNAAASFELAGGTLDLSARTVALSNLVKITGNGTLKTPTVGLNNIQFNRGVTVTATNTLSLNAGQKLEMMNVGTGNSTWTGNITLNGGTIHLGIDLAQLLVDGNVTFGTTATTFDMTGRSVPLVGETISLITATGSILSFDPDSSYILTGIDNSSGNLIIALEGKSLVLKVSSLAPVSNWIGGAAGDWTIGASSAWSNGSFANGNAATFKDQSGVALSTVTVKANVEPESITIQNQDTEYVFNNDGGKISGNTSVVKSGTGAVTFNGTNDFSGGVTIKDGSIKANAASALGTGGITLQGGQLIWTENATLGTGSQIAFAGGTLVYDTPATSGFVYADLSPNIMGATTDSIIKVDTGVNNITWAGNVSAYGLDVKGTGTLTLSGSTSYAKTINVNAGSSLTLKTTATTEVAGNISGDGTIILDNQNNTRFTITGDNSGFTGDWILKGTGIAGLVKNTRNDVGFNVNSLGSGTTITLEGRGMYIATAGGVCAADLIVGDSGGFLNGNGGATYTYSGSLTSTSSASILTTAIFIGTINMTGDLTGFSGTITSPAEGTFTWQFGNNTAGILGSNGEIFGDGAILLNNQNATPVPIAYKFGYTNEQAVLNALVKDGASTLTQNGTGTLILAKDNTSTGLMTIASGKVQIGNGGAEGAWAGNIAGAGALLINRTTGTVELKAGNTYAGGTTITDGNVKALGADSFGAAAGAITMKKGSIDFNSQAVANALTIEGGNLSNAGAVTGNITVNAKEGGAMSLGNAKGAQIKGITTTVAGTTLSGIDGNVTLSTSSLALNLNNVKGQASETAAVNFGTGATSTNTLSLDELNLTLDADVVSLLGSTSTYDLLITNGLLGGAITTAAQTQLQDYVKISPLLAKLGYAVKSVNSADGSVTVTGEATTGMIYLVGSAGRTLEYSQELNPYAAAMVDGTLTINWQAGTDNKTAVLKNLEGTSGNGLINAGSDADTIVQIENDLDLGAGVSSTYKGSITGAGTLVKTGQYDQIINGNVNMDKGIDIDQGNLAVNGNVTTSDMNVDGGNVSISGTAAIGNLDVSNGKKASLTGGNNSLGDVTVTGAQSELALGGATTINGTTAITQNGSITGAAPLTIAQSANVTVDQGGSMSSGPLAVNGNLTATDANINAYGVTGTGNTALNGTSKLTSSTNDTAIYNGTLSGTGTFAMTGSGVQSLIGQGGSGVSLDIAAGTINLQHASSQNVAYNDLRVASGARLALGNPNPGLTDLPTTLTLSGGATFEQGSHLSIFASPGVTTSYISSTGNISLGNGLAVDILSNGETTGLSGNSWVFTLMESAGSITGSATVNFDGIFKTLFASTSTAVVTEGGKQKLVVTAVRTMNNPYMQYANSSNSQAGATMIWNASLVQMPKNGTTFYNIINCLSNAVDSGNAAQAAHIMSAISGSSITALVSTQKESSRMQMESLRNRIVQMGLEDGYVYEDAPYFHAWINGSAAYSKIDQRGDEAGYSMDTYGGTVGFDVNVDSTFTFGAAFTANYNKFNSSAADWANGDNDGYYVNLFGKATHKEWSHILILTGGWNEATINRTVSYCPNNPAYFTSGKTDGSVWSGMYELGYDIAMNHDKTNFLQPLFNISFTSFSMDDYTERGTDNANLSVNGMDGTYGTVGVGARWHGTFGQNLFNRSAYGELRALVLQDFGDTQSEADVRFVGSTGGATVKGAKVGTTGVQIGAGITVPVGVQSSVFADAAVDVRSHAVATGGSLGFRYDF